jgi:hypothetical protein
MKLRLACLLVGALLVTACAWNEESASFPTRAEFQASRYAGQLPPNLLPASARNIEFKHNIDTTVVEVSFDFAVAEHEALVQPFMSFDQLRLRMALADQGGPALPLPSMLMRCGDGPMEFLKIDPPGHARYWTDFDKARRQRACTNGASQPSTSA